MLTLVGVVWICLIPFGIGARGIERKQRTLSLMTMEGEWSLRVAQADGDPLCWSESEVRMGRAAGHAICGACEPRGKEERRESD